MNALQDRLVPVRGVVVDVARELGVYLDIQDRRVFVPADRTLSALRRLKRGEIVSLQVDKDYAVQDGLVAGNASSVAPVGTRFSA
jgi:hypothetical protein